MGIDFDVVRGRGPIVLGDLARTLKANTGGWDSWVERFFRNSGGQSCGFSWMSVSEVIFFVCCIFWKFVDSSFPQEKNNITTMFFVSQMVNHQV